FLSFIASAVVSLGVGGGLYLFFFLANGFIKNPLDNIPLWIIPLGVFSLAFYNSCQFWLTRQKEFSVIAKCKVVQTLFGITSQLLLGMIAATAIGLVSGPFLNYLLGALILAYTIFKIVRDKRIRLTP